MLHTTIRNPSRPSADQTRALRLMTSGPNVFLTGKAGTGKSSVVHTFKSIAGDNVAFLSPTGLAAMNIGGTTIHRYLGLQPIDWFPQEYTPTLSDDRIQAVAATETIVLDEISMVRSDIFALLARVLGQHPLPGRHRWAFGGRKIIVVGDFHQLPPVFRDAPWEEEESSLMHGPWAFECFDWMMALFEPAILTVAHRQTEDARFVSVLDVIRQGESEQLGACLEWLNRNVIIGNAPRESTVLCTHRSVANRINQQRDAEIGTAPVVFRGDWYGQIEPDEFPTDAHLALRLSSRVRLLCNRYRSDGMAEFVNGDVGTVVSIDGERRSVEVLLDNGRTVVVNDNEWLKRELHADVDPMTGRKVLCERIVGGFRQIPLKLAHALTIHKAQGMTLDRVHFCFGDSGPFAAGQTYTALSRCRSIAGLSLSRPILPADVLVSPKVLDFYAVLANARA